MKYLALFLLLIFGVSCLSDKSKVSELIVLGTVHFPTANVTSDSILDILNEVKPDIIVMEADSSVFNEDFSFKKTYDENEYNAVVSYQKLHPEVMVRPMEFEGRNEYRKEIGIYSEAGFVYNFLFELLDAEKLSEENSDLLIHYENLWAVQEVYKTETLRHINQPEVDRLIDSVLNYQYIKVKTIIDSREEFEKAEITDARKDTVSLRKYFEKWSHFEGTQRNEAMASNLKKIILENSGKRILALTGFKHRPPLLNSIKEDHEIEIQIMEYYELK